MGVRTISHGFFPRPFPSAQLHSPADALQLQALKTLVLLLGKLLQKLTGVMLAKGGATAAHMRKRTNTNLRSLHAVCGLRTDVKRQLAHRLVVLVRRRPGLLGLLQSGNKQPQK